MQIFLYLFVVFSVGPGTEEVHPKISYQTCTKSGCTNQNGGVVADSEWREIVTSDGKHCYNNGNWDQSVCSSETDCAKVCNLNGFNYSSIGVTTSGSSVRLPFLTPTKDIGSRIYLFDETAGTYVNFHPINKEFTFDVDVSTVACGINAALYFVEMDADGGMKRFPQNTAGAKYGTGYCDAQCPKDGKFIGNYANVQRKYGSCCFEWDIWEANAYATQWAAHPCNVDTPAYVCDSNCQMCDTSGCAFNHYREGDHQYYGPGLKVDTKKKFTVVTQFVSDTGSDSGKLLQVNRFYVQDGKLIPCNIRIDHDVGYTFINDAYCKAASGDAQYANLGGDAAFTASFKRGAVLAMSIWTDGSMAWLDSGNSGPCENNPGKDSLVANNPNAYVEYSNIRFGDINTTYSAT